MKKIIFLLLLAQTISFLYYADSGCIKHSYRWGIKAAEHTQCYCNCEKYAQAHGKCIQCGHKRIPTNLKIKTTT